jgi:hypothetical protein
MSFKGWTVEQYWDANANKPKLASGKGENGRGYIVSVPGTTDLDGNNVWAANDVVIFILDQWVRVSNGVSPPSVGAVVTGAAGMTQAEAKLTSFGANPPETLRTIGRAVPGDLGGALYKNIISLPAAPFTNVGTWTSADGWHFQQVLETGEVWVEQFGADGSTDPNNTVDTWQAFEDAKNFVLFWRRNQKAYKIRAGLGYFYLSKSFHMLGAVFDLEGSASSSGGGVYDGTTLTFPAHTDGVFTHDIHTFEREGNRYFWQFEVHVGQLVWNGGTHIYVAVQGGFPAVAGAGPSGTSNGQVDGAVIWNYLREKTYSEQLGDVNSTAGATIRNITVLSNWPQAGYPNAAEIYSGIIMRCRGNVIGCFVANWVGHGIVVAGNGDNEYVGGGNANGWYIGRCAVYANQHCGIKVGYGDGNAGTGEHIDVAYNGEWGIYDRSFLGNRWFSVQSANDGNASPIKPFVNVVTYNGRVYYARLPTQNLDAAPNYANAPDTDTNSWTFYYGDGTLSPTTAAPAWVNTGTYKPGGAFASIDFNARSTWQGVYIEDSSQPAQWMGRDYIFGLTSRGVLAFSHNTPATIFDANTIVNHPRILREVPMTDGTFKSFTMDLGPKKGDYNHFDRNIMSWNDASVNYSLAGGDTIAGTDYLMVCNGSIVTYGLTTGAGGINLGTTAHPAGIMAASNFALGATNGTSYRRWWMDDAAPTTGEHARGERVYLFSPSASGIEGYVCVASGTPGTWKAFGSIAA